MSYEIFIHPLAYTSQEIAAKTRCAWKRNRVNGTLLMAVITGSHKISLDTYGRAELERATGYDDWQLKMNLSRAFPAVRSAPCRRLAISLA